MTFRLITEEEDWVIKHTKKMCMIKNEKMLRIESTLLFKRK